MFICRYKVEKAWIDHNQHMNVSYYQHVFQKALYHYWEHLSVMEENSLNGMRLSMRDAHIRYISEALLGELIEVHSFLHKLDKNGFSVYQEMKRGTDIISVFNQRVNFIYTEKSGAHLYNQDVFEFLFEIVKKTKIKIPDWIDRSINI